MKFITKRAKIMTMLKSDNVDKFGAFSHITYLIRSANKLDKIGLFAEADILDEILKKIASKNSLIRSLKEDDPIAAHNALVGISGEDLGLTTEEFKSLTNKIDSAREINENLKDAGSDDWKIEMDGARNILGVEKNVKTLDNNKIDTNKINPFTMKPWTGPAVDDDLLNELRHLKSILDNNKAPSGSSNGGVYIDHAQYYIGIKTEHIPKDSQALLKELEQNGYKKYIYDGSVATRSKKQKKYRIIVETDNTISEPDENKFFTNIVVSPINEETYNAVAKVFGGVKETFKDKDNNIEERELKYDEAFTP